MYFYQYTPRSVTEYIVGININGVVYIIIIHETGVTSGSDGTRSPAVSGELNERRLWRGATISINYNYISRHVRLVVHNVAKHKTVNVLISLQIVNCYDKNYLTCNNM